MIHHLNVVICAEGKGKDEAAEGCYERIKDKDGILGKQCNSTRPLNSVMFVASLSSESLDINYLLAESGFCL
jgi:hypothetical protein